MVFLATSNLNEKGTRQKQRHTIQVRDIPTLHLSFFFFCFSASTFKFFLKFCSLISIIIFLHYLHRMLMSIIQFRVGSVPTPTVVAPQPQKPQPIPTTRTHISSLYRRHHFF